MSVAIATERVSIAAAAENAVRDLVRVTHWGRSSFVNLPLIYPDGSSVTVKLDPVREGPGTDSLLIDGLVRVSDNGFAFRILESIGVQSRFGRAARAIAKRNELAVDKHIIFADVGLNSLSRAICDVAVASWVVAEEAFLRAAEEDHTEFDETLRDRLQTIFPERVDTKTRELRGASATLWRVSAIVGLEEGRMAIFQTVGKTPLSVNTASTSFLDLGGLEPAPNLIAVVRKKSDLGSRLGLLSQAGGRVIEEAQPDDVYERAVDAA
jgi:hypothetical protein